MDPRKHCRDLEEFASYILKKLWFSKKNNSEWKVDIKMIDIILCMADNCKYLWWSNEMNA